MGTAIRNSSINSHDLVYGHSKSTQTPMNEFTEVRRAPFLRKNVHIQMDPQDHSARLLSKEWLVKIDNERSIPYLMVRPSFGTVH